MIALFDCIAFATLLTLMIYDIAEGDNDNQGINIRK